MQVKLIVTDSFLRTKAKTDPFYDPIIKVIEGQADMEWKVFVARKGVKCGYPTEKISDYWLFEKLGIWFYRACRLLLWHIPAWKIYRWYGVASRFLFARKFHADVVITQSGQFGETLSSLLPHARIVDIQHGVIYSRHCGYFDCNGRINDVWRSATNREFWLFGQGYADCFFKNPKNAKDLEGRVKVIGDVIRAGEEEEGKRKKEDVSGARNLVVFSAQLTGDLARDETVASVRRMEEFFDEFFKKFGDRWMANVLEVETMGSGHRTKITVEKLK